MALELQTSASAAKKDAKSAALLNKYMKGAVKGMKNMTKMEASNEVAKMMENVDLNDFSLDQVEARRKEVKSEMKKYGFQEKLNYFSDSHASDANPQEATAKTIGAVSVVILTSVTTAIASSAEATIGVLGMGTAAILGKATMAWLSRAENADQAKKIAEYVDLKHANLALRKLENALIKKECKELTQEAYAKGMIPVTPRYPMMPMTPAFKNKEGR